LRVCRHYILPSFAGISPPRVKLPTAGAATDAQHRLL
jgi:hypothetical protein